MRDSTARDERRRLSHSQSFPGWVWIIHLHFTAAGNSRSFTPHLNPTQSSAIAWAITATLNLLVLSFIYDLFCTPLRIIWFLNPQRERWVTLGPLLSSYGARGAGIDLTLKLTRDISRGRWIIISRFDPFKNPKQNWCSCITSTSPSPLCCWDTIARNEIHTVAKSQHQP